MGGNINKRYRDKESLHFNEDVRDGTRNFGNKFKMYRI